MKIKPILFISILLIIYVMVGCASADVNIPSGNLSSYSLNSANTVYKLTGDAYFKTSAFSQSASNVTLDGQGYKVYFAITGSGQGISSSSSYSRLIIKNVNFITNYRSSEAIPFYLSGGSHITITNVTTFSTNGHGVLIQNINYVNISNLTANCASNMAFYSNNVNWMIANGINATSGTSYAGDFNPTNNSIISNSNFISTSSTGAFGENSNNLTFINCNFLSTSGQGAYFYHVTGLNLYNCISNSAGSIGLELYNNVNTTVKFCLENGVNNYGFYIKSCTNTTLNNNTINSSGVGLETDNCGINITNSSISSSNIYGANFCNSIGSNITNCKFFSSNERGMFLQNCLQTKISNSTITGNAASGICLLNSSNSIMNNNKCSSNSSYGVWFSTNSFNNSMTNSICSSNTSNAIYVYSNSTNNVFNAIKCISISYWGINIVNSTPNTWSNIAVISPYDPTSDFNNGVLLVGDSLIMGGKNGTASYGTFDTSLNNSLNKYLSDSHIMNKGYSGETSTTALTRFSQELQIYKPRFVILEYGTNDISAGVPQQTIINNLISMAQTAQAAGITPFISLIPASGHIDNNQKIYLDQNISTRAASVGIHIINWYDLLDSKPLNGLYDNYVDQYYIDGTHPNDVGNALLGPYLAKSILTSVDFGVSINSGTTPLTVKFSDLSPCVNNRSWDFENDGHIDSTQKNPVYIYRKTGVFSVNLTVNNQYGTLSTVKSDYITVTAPSFTSDPTYWFYWVYNYLNSMLMCWRLY